MHRLRPNQIKPNYFYTKYEFSKYFLLLFKIFHKNSNMFEL
jgi:hypothetical protein